MSRTLRLLMLAAVFNISAAAIAGAQTVLVKGATPGDRIELFIEGARVAEGVIGPDGQGTVIGQLPVNESNNAEMDARVYVDTCENLQRVHLVDKNLQPIAREEGCERRDIAAVFWVQQRSTLVIDVGGAIPTVLLRQGVYDPTVSAQRESPRGLVLSAGGGWGSLDDLLAVACGNVGECEGTARGGTYAAGATFWILRAVAVEGTYIKPRKASYEGSGSNFRFNYFLDSEIFAVGGKLAAPIGPIRLYGHGGGAFQRTTSSTTQTNDPREFTTADGVTHTVAGGTQTIEATTEGWGWYGGGGLEGWVSPRVALFAEGTFVKLEGEPTSGTDVPTNTRFIGAFAGLRLRVF